jgi:predicted transcriptional regulator
MKAITIHVSEPVYREFQDEARRRDRPASELILAAMEQYRQQHFQNRTTLTEPLSAAAVGEVLQPWSSRAELLDSLLDRDR